MFTESFAYQQGGLLSFSPEIIVILASMPWGFPGGFVIKNPPPSARDAGDADSSLEWMQEDPLEKEMTTHSSILVWEIPWSEEPGGLQSMGPQRVELDRATEYALCNDPTVKPITNFFLLLYQHHDVFLEYSRSYCSLFLRNPIKHVVHATHILK